MAMSFGILAAIALPSFLNQANKGKQAEGKQYVSSINKSQQAYYTENGTFITASTPNDWASLAVGIKTQTSNYKYSMSPAGTDGVNAIADATQISKALKNYTGVVGLIAPVAGADKTSQAVVCETKNAGDAPAAGTVAPVEVQCPGNALPLK